VACFLHLPTPEPAPEKPLMSDEHRDPAFRDDPATSPEDAGEQDAPAPERAVTRTEGDRDRAAGRDAPAREQPDGSPLHPRDTGGDEGNGS
jgi:hypothetical protein